MSLAVAPVATGARLVLVVLAAVNAGPRRVPVIFVRIEQFVDLQVRGVGVELLVACRIHACDLGVEASVARHQALPGLLIGGN